MVSGRFSTLGAAVLALWVAAPACGRAIPNAELSVLARQAADNHWVDTWTSMPQLVEQDNLPPSPFKGSGIFKDATLRQTLQMSIGASRIRIQISNTFGGSELPITAASVAFPEGGRAGVGGIDAASLKGVTFGGKASISIAKGQVAYSDPIDIDVKPQSMLTVTLYSEAGQSGTSITGHPGSRTTSLMQTGNHVNATSVSGGSAKHWYFVSAVEAWVPKDYGAFIILGDSITDGRGSDDDKNNRWANLLLARMQKEGLTKIGVNNQAAGGNTILSGGLGPTLLTRYTRDAIQQQGVKYIMVFEGVNDIGGGGTDASTQTGIGDRIISAYKQIIADAHKIGVPVFGATITPFGGSGQSYSNPTRDATRKKVNDFIKTGGAFDGVVDFDKMIGDASNPSQLGKSYDGGDHLHPNVAGYQAMADGFPLDLFKKFENGRPA